MRDDSSPSQQTHFDIKPQVAMMPILKKVPGTDLADSALDGLLHDLQHRYSNIPGPKAIDAPPSFERYVNSYMYLRNTSTHLESTISEAKLFLML